MLVDHKHLLDDERRWLGGAPLPSAMGASAEWEALREETFRGQKEKGWIPESTKLTPIDETMVKWSDIEESHKPFHRRLMEVYAGYLEHTDHHGHQAVRLQAAPHAAQACVQRGVLIPPPRSL